MKDLKTPTEDSETSIRLLSIKLRGIAYLIENFHDDAGEPFDIEDIFWGIGMVLSEISQNLKTISIQLGDEEAHRSKKKQKRA